MSVDENVVSLKFDNAGFSEKIAGTMSMLDKLRERLSLKGAEQGLKDIDAAQSNLDFSNMADGIENVSSKFNALGAIGFTVIQELTGALIDFAKKQGDFLLDPLIGGGKRRAENIEQAMFMFRGLGMDITASMESARLAVTGTAYGLDDAARAAAQMGGSGLRAGDQMTGALRGIAGIAAMTNSSYSEMADIFITAAGNGKVMSNELQRISHRGVNAAAALAKEWGLTEAQVRDMASTGEISFEMFASGMDAAFGEHATKANETYTGSLANLRAALARIGASFAIPRLTQQRDLFNTLSPIIDKVHTSLKPLIKTFAIMTGLSTISLIQKLNGLDLSKLDIVVPNIQKGLANAFKGIHEIITTIKDAFRDVFPPSTTSALVRFSEIFRDLLVRLNMGEGPLAKIRSIFKGVFSVLAMGIEVVKNVAGMFGAMFKSIDGPDGGGILDFLANLGERLAWMKLRLVDGGGIARFFEDLGPKLKAAATFVADAFRTIRGVVSDMIDIFGPKLTATASAVATVFGRISDVFEGFFGAAGSAGTAGMDAASNASDRLSQRWGWLGKVGLALGGALLWLADKLLWVAEKAREFVTLIGSAFKEASFDHLTDTLNVGILAGILVAVRGFFGKLNDFTGAGFRERFEAIMETVTSTLDAMQVKLKSEALLNIAFAIGVLAASLLVLSMIDSAKLTKALAATAVGFGQLAVTMSALTRIEMGPSGAAKLNAIATALIMLGFALILFSLAAKVMSTMDTDELLRGLGGIAALLGILVVTLKSMPNTKGLISTSIGIMGIAAALILLTIPVKILGGMDTKEMIKGLLGVALLLTALTIAVKNMPSGKGMVSTGLGILAMSVGLALLVIPVKKLADMEIKKMLQGLLGVALLLTALTIAMKNMPPNMAATGLGLLLIAGGLFLVSASVALLGTMDMKTLIQGLVGIAAVLAILVIAANAMVGAIGGAAAILVMSAALVVLALAVTMFAALGWDALIVALVGIAAVLIIFALAATLLAPVIPTMLSLAGAMLIFGAALALIGASVFLVGAGLLMIAKALGALVSLVTDSLDGLIMLFDLIITKAVQLAEAIFDALLSMLKDFIAALPGIFTLLGKAFGALLEVLRERMPEFFDFISELITGILTLIVEKTPEFIEAGVSVLMAFLTGIRDNLVEITNVVIDIILAFTTTVTERMPELITTGAALIVAFIEGLTSKATDLVTAMVGLIVSMLEGITAKAEDLVKAGVDLIVAVILGIGTQVDEIIAAGGWVVEQVIKGIGGAISGILQAAVDFVVQFCEDLGKQWYALLEAGGKLVLKIIDGVLGMITAVGAAAADLVIQFLNELAVVIDEKAPQLAAAGGRIAGAIMKGVVTGLPSFVMGAFEGLTGIGGSDKDAPATKAKGQGTEIGRAYGDGVVEGIDQNGSTSQKVARIGDNLTAGFGRSIEGLSSSIEAMDEFSPKITPVLDLTNIKDGAGEIGKLVGLHDISASTSFDQASLISETTAGSADKVPEPKTEPSEIKFEQNIYAPTALRTGEIYRQTKAQIVLAKEKLSA